MVVVSVMAAGAAVHTSAVVAADRHRSIVERTGSTSVVAVAVVVVVVVSM